MTEQAVAAMNRLELFAFLKERKASIGATVSNDVLRTAALAEVRKGAAAA